MLSFSVLPALLLAYISLCAADDSSCPQDTSGVPSPVGKWTSLAPIPVPRQEGQVVSIDQSIYYLGGILSALPNGTFPTVNLTQRYDIPTDTWTTLAEMPVAFNHLNVAVVDGKIYVLGGMVLENGLWNSSRSAFVYDPCADSWSELGLVPAGRQAGSAAVGVIGTTIYLAGGILETVVGNFSADASFADDTTDMFSSYDTVSQEWNVLPNMPAPRDHAGRGVVGNKLYVLGGREFNSRTNDGIVNTTFSYDIESQQWCTDLADQPTARGGISSATIDDVIYTIGGEGNMAPGTNGVFDNTEAYNTTSNTWVELTPMPVPRHGSAAVAINRRIYFPGGGTTGGGMPTFFFDYLQQ